MSFGVSGYNHPNYSAGVGSAGGTSSSNSAGATSTGNTGSTGSSSPQDNTQKYPTTYSGFEQPVSTTSYAAARPRTSDRMDDGVTDENGIPKSPTKAGSTSSTSSTSSAGSTGSAGSVNGTGSAGSAGSVPSIPQSEIDELLRLQKENKKAWEDWHASGEIADPEHPEWLIAGTADPELTKKLDEARRAFVEKRLILEAKYGEEAVSKALGE